MRFDLPPRVAYVLLWFPLASETFIFREIESLSRLNLDIHTYTMYGDSRKGCTRDMLSYPGQIKRMGVGASWKIAAAFARALKNRPALVRGLLREGLFRRMRNAESQAENFWCFMAGFLLAEECRKDGIMLIHAPWANGPATAAWVASRLSDIPFGFTGRAGDIYPPDGLLAEKSRTAEFVRTNNAANLAWLGRHVPLQKLKLVYNGLTLPSVEPQAPARPHSPPRLLAVGRFARTKGFTYLLTALARLKRERFACVLTLVGDGAWMRRLRKLRGRLGLEDMVDMPGFLPNDKISGCMASHDLLIVPSVVHSNGDRDGIPNVIMEASALGLPVIATNVCGIPEIIKDGQTGRLVPQRDAAALARAIRTSIEEYDSSLQMARNARQLVLDMFDPEKNAASLRDIYLGAMRNGHDNV